jgi:hypothetical protein
MTKPTEAEIEAQARLAFDGPNGPNITQQGLLVKMLGGDLAKAAEVAQQYGGKLGTTEQRRPEKIATHTNPWSDAFKGDDAQRLAEQQRILKTGTKFAASLAKAAGKTVFGYPIR